MNKVNVSMRSRFKQAGSSLLKRTSDVFLRFPWLLCAPLVAGAGAGYSGPEQLAMGSILGSLISLAIVAGLRQPDAGDFLEFLWDTKTGRNVFSSLVGMLVANLVLLGTLKKCENSANAPLIKNLKEKATAIVVLEKQDNKPYFEYAEGFSYRCWHKEMITCGAELIGERLGDVCAVAPIDPYGQIGKPELYQTYRDYRDTASGPLKFKRFMAFDRR